LSPEAPRLLAERRALLAEHPAQYAGLLAGPAAAQAVDEAARFARQWTGPAPEDLSGEGLCRWLGAHWEPDVLLVLPAETGSGPRLGGGALCFPSHWDLREKMGGTLAQVHEPVPGLNTSLEEKIDAFLSRLRPGGAWKRWNWALSASGQRNDHPSLRLPRPAASATLHNTWLRMEEQAFVRLPETGCILFGIRLHLVPLAQVVQVSGAAARLADLLASLSEAMAAYKGVAGARSALIRQLRAVADPSNGG
jgi:hypothetical protein